jgi:V8-like Glu-specific endopeptidase
MITAEIIQQTEARFAQRQAIRQEREAKIKSGRILEADTPERVKERLQHLATRAVIIEGVGLPAPGQAAAATSDLERILGRNDLMSVRYLEIGLRIARTVGRVHVRSADGNGFGTGFLVSPKLLMTNNHVLENAQTAGASRVEFNFQEGPDGRLLPSIFLDFDPASFFITDRTLDFSVVALKGNLSNISKFGWNGLSAAEGKLIVGEYVSIIQHPSGERKQVALRENQVIDVLDSFAHYRTDTSPGSSGSPVFNDQWEIVALHHSGIPKKDSQGRILATNGAVWTQSMGQDKIHWIANEGVRISKILRHIQGLSMSGPQAALRNQLLQSEKGWTGGRESTEQTAVEGVEGGRPNSWTLPLQLTIDVSGGMAGLSIGGKPTEASPAAAAVTNGGGGEHAGSADEMLGAWRAYESASYTPEAEAPPAAAPAPPPPRVQTAAEWLTGAPSTPATMQEQFGRAA